ncbi:MAG: hypothetical protein HPY71_08090 [Firmicutes bacterium]|nr:hypothetical protein [Bacillota bacterium]
MVEGITLYPSSWYYNACLYGFLKVVAYGLGEDYIERNVLKDDGTIYLCAELLTTVFSTPKEGPPVIPLQEDREPPLSVSDIKRFAWWWVEMSREMIVWEEKDKALSDPSPDDIIQAVCGRVIAGMPAIVGTHFGGFQKYYNLFQKEVYRDKKAFLNRWFSAGKAMGLEKCSLCGQPVCYPEDDFEIRQYHRFFMAVLSYNLASSPQFPNSFWDLNPNSLICPLCRSILLCSHFAAEQRLFANTNDLAFNWYFNKFLLRSHAMFTRPASNRNYQELFGRFLHSNSQISLSMGAWRLQGLEFINFTADRIEHYILPPLICDLLLNPIASGLFTKIRNQAVLKHIMEERYEHLPNVCYKSLRNALKTTPDNTIDQDFEARLSLSGTISLCRLYIEIRKLRQEGRNHFMVNFDEILKAGRESPLVEDKGSLTFRLLELVRLGRKEETYYLLLRSYIANNRPFPTALLDVLRLRDLNFFRNSMFGYISGIAEARKEKEEQGGEA